MGITNKKGNKQMIGLFIAIIGVNIFAFKINKYVTKAQMVSIWAFTVAFKRALIFIYLLSTMVTGILIKI